MAAVRIPFREGFLAGDLHDLASVRLMGNRCLECDVRLFGVRHRCENCSSRHLAVEVFSDSGRIYTYTVQRYPPPKPHALSGDWTPRVLAWVDLDEAGPRILSIVDCKPEAARIGTKTSLDCEVGWVDQEGREVVTYRFRPSLRVGSGARQEPADS